MVNIALNATLDSMLTLLELAAMLQKPIAYNLIVMVSVYLVILNLYYLMVTVLDHSHFSLKIVSPMILLINTKTSLTLHTVISSLPNVLIVLLDLFLIFLIN